MTIPLSSHLREYQKECVLAIEREHGEIGVRSTLIVLATGLGKTVIFTEWVRRRLLMFGGRVLVLAHREELVQQAADQLAAAIPSGRIGVEMAGRYTSSLMPESVVVASVQTIGQEKRLNRFSPYDFTGIVIDEAHHANAESYLKILRHFHASQVLGVTATPDRLDGKGLGRVFDSHAFSMDISEGIDAGFLVPIIAKRVICESMDLSRLRPVRGDLTAADLEQAMNQDRVLHEMAGPLVREAGTRSTIVFTPTVATAQALVDVLAGYTKARAAVIHGGTESLIRHQVLDDYKRGEIQFLVNCAVLTEGFDSPRTSCVALARPTKSRALMTQCVGRGTRPDKQGGSTKTDLLVIDFVGVVGGKLKLCSPIDVLSDTEGKSSEYIARVQQLADQGERLDRAHAQAEREAKEAERVAKERERQEKEEAARRQAAKVYSQARYATRTVNPFTGGTAYGSALVVPVDRDGPKMTEQQREYLQRLGFEGTLTKKQAHAAIGQAIVRNKKGLCTFKQAKTLAKNGYDPADITKAEASKIIGELIKKWEDKKALDGRVASR